MKKVGDLFPCCLGDGGGRDSSWQGQQWPWRGQLTAGTAYGRAALALMGTAHSRGSAGSGGDSSRRGSDGPGGDSIPQGRSWSLPPGAPPSGGLSGSPSCPAQPGHTERRVTL